MKCNRNNILLYWSNELTSASEHEVKRHLAVCNECQSMLNELMQIEIEAKQEELPGSECDFASKAFKIVDEERQKNSNFVKSLFRIAASVMIIVLSGLLFYNSVLKTCSDNYTGDIIAEEDLKYRLDQIGDRIARAHNRKSMWHDDVFQTSHTVFSPGEKLKALKQRTRTSSKCLTVKCRKSLVEIFSTKRG